MDDAAMPRDTTMTDALSANARKTPEASSPTTLAGWYPDTRPNPPPDTFEVGLALAGAVSAGAYTAGVLDFLVEALDAWCQAKQDPDALVPRHNVNVRVVTGASAGGMSGAILAAVCRSGFPHVTAQTPEDVAVQNPFYRTWVMDIDIAKLLGTRDLETGPLISLLDCSPLAETAKELISWKGRPVAPGTRDWLADPFQLTLTLTNLRGVPYQVRFSGHEGANAHRMAMHADNMSFAVPVAAPVPSGSFPPQFVPLPLTNQPNDPAWQLLATAAQATGAFPLALRAVPLSRDPDDYAWQFVYPSAAAAGDTLPFAQPAWDGNAPRPYTFHSADGGIINNEPFEVAHRALAGYLGRNTRNGTDARRAVVMIDPFTDGPTCAECTEPWLVDVARALGASLMQQARFKPMDVVLAQSQQVFSRFLVAPLRHHGASKWAVAGGGLGAFLGFFSRHYRRHDFLLGRANCAEFLREFFVLPADNKLFEPFLQRLGAAGTGAFCSRERPGHMQIIPLVGSAAQPQPEPDWPQGQFGGYDAIADKVERRAQQVFVALRRELPKRYSSRLTHAIAWSAAVLWHLVGRRKLLKWIKEQVDSAVKVIDGCMQCAGTDRENGGSQ